MPEISDTKLSFNIESLRLVANWMFKVSMTYKSNPIKIYFRQLLTEKKVKLQLLLSIPWMNKKFRCNVTLTQSVLKFTKLPKMANPISLKAWKMGPTSASEIPEINGNLNEWLTEKENEWHEPNLDFSGASSMPCWDMPHRVMLEDHFE